MTKTTVEECIVWIDETAESFDHIGTGREPSKAYYKRFNALWKETASLLRSLQSMRDK